DAHVGRGYDLRGVARGWSVDGTDNGTGDEHADPWLRPTEARVEMVPGPPLAGLRSIGATNARLLGRRQVGARGEGATVARDHDGTDRIVVADLLHAPRDHVEHVHVHRVELVGP